MAIQRSTITRELPPHLHVRVVLATVLALAAVLLPVSPASAAGGTLKYRITGSDDKLQPLDGATVSEEFRVWTQPAKSYRKVSYFIDDPRRSSAPVEVDDAAPFTLTVSPDDVAAGTHRITAAAVRKTGGTEVLHADVTIVKPATAPVTSDVEQVERTLWYRPSGSSGIPLEDLDGTTITEDVRTFLRPDEDLRSVAYHIDGAAVAARIDDATPFTYELKTGSLSVGTHTLETQVTRLDGAKESHRFTFHVLSASVESPTGTVEEPEVQLDPEPEQPVAGDGTLGLHVTAAELQTWRTRAESGPFKSQGDWSANSPADWTRISSNAAAFAANPSEGHWLGPVANTPGGCVSQVNTEASDTAWVPPYREATETRDAAFVAMVKQDGALARQVADVLLAQVAEPGVRFSDRSRWCLDSIRGDGNPVFNISNWLTRLLFTYDYLTITDPTLFSATQQRQIDDWFAASAVWVQDANDDRLDELFVNRRAGDYTINPNLSDNWSRQLYVGGPEARTLHRRYNNRAAVGFRYVALVGVEQGNADFVASSKRFVKESLAYTYFPDGSMAEFERWTSTVPTKGWKYAAEYAGDLLTIADVLARAGDTELASYATTDGALGTQGQHHSGRPKSLLTLSQDVARYVDGSYNRTAGSTDSRYRISSIDNVASIEWAHDLALVSGFRTLGDDYLRSVVTRKASGAPLWPAKPRHSQGDPEGGQWGIYPGVMFQFG